MTTVTQIFRNFRFLSKIEPHFRQFFASYILYVTFIKKNRTSKSSSTTYDLLMISFTSAAVLESSLDSSSFDASSASSSLESSASLSSPESAASFSLLSTSSAASVDDLSTFSSLLSSFLSSSLESA